MMQFNIIFPDIYKIIKENNKKKWEILLETASSPTFT